MMKNIRISLVKYFCGLFIFALFFSCQTYPAPSPIVGVPTSPRPSSIIVKTTSEKNTSLIDIGVNIGWKTSPGHPNGGLDGFGVGFKNLTDKVVKIVWEQSSLVYGGQSSLMFTDGQKYSEAGRPMSATILPPKAFISKVVYPATQVRYSSGIPEIGMAGSWHIDPVYDTSEYTLLFCVQSDGVEDFYTTLVTFVP